MSSFAIFTNKNNEKFQVDVHFNLWNKNYDDNYLDIGIMSYDLKDSQKIYVWFPFKVEPEQINDLKTSLEDIDIINAIFNENYTLERTGNTKWIYINQNEKCKFRIYLLDISQDISIADKEKLGFYKNDNSSVVELAINRDNNNKKSDFPVYLRFRIKLPEITEIIHEYNKPHHWIRGAFSKNYVIDFRYNDKRSFSASENEILTNKYYLAQTKKLHFLLMTKVYVDVECSTDVKKRRLEPNIWKKYVLDDDTTDIIAYHATKKIVNQDTLEDIGSWEFFAKQTVETENWKLLIFFIIFTIFLGAIGSLAGNYLDNLISNYTFSTSSNIIPKVGEEIVYFIQSHCIF